MKNTKELTKDQLILIELEKARVNKFYYSKENPIKIVVGTFEAKINPEHLEEVIKRYKSIINKDCSQYVFRVNCNFKNYSRNMPKFKEYKLETFCMQGN